MQIEEKISITSKQLDRLKALEKNAGLRVNKALQQFVKKYLDTYLDELEKEVS